ncbi:hypothetical protein NQ315_013870 [Exocentrus adspersus]|uniref:Male-enhanced antigen 1 n=1 Tax=Exocentrus adspersus TaxID=1586481 RepID=A0AAV8VHN3_9CUCU|nr:hypothetical protein NQ315_013870 [Exocentrus adspersus]
MVNPNTVISLIGVTAMGTSDTGLPDPDNPNNEVRATNDIILVTDDEEESDDQDTPVTDEYRLLSTDDNAEMEHFSTSDDDDHDEDHDAILQENSASSTNSTIPPITSVEEELVKEVWSAPLPKTVDIEMDSRKVDEVKQVMMNITLPSSSIPDWATNIPEEEWKNQLLKRLQNIQEREK